MFTDLIKLASQGRRDMPRNPIVLGLCDGVETLVAKVSELEAEIDQLREVASRAKAEDTEASKQRRKVYMREYMRKARSEGRWR